VAVGDSRHLVASHHVRRHFLRERDSSNPSGTRHVHLTRLRSIGHSTPLSSLGLSHSQLQSIASQLRGASQVVLADVDQDGFFRSTIGAMPALPLVAPADFLPRRRSRLQLVATDGDVGVRKYHVNRWRFLNELRVLRILERAGCHVPAVLNADFEKLSITVSFVAGSVLREELAKHAAIVRDRDVQGHPGLGNLDERCLWHARIREGKRVLYEVISRDFADRILDELRMIHSARVIWGDLKYGNIVIEQRTGRPYLIDFDAAGYFPRMPSRLFRALCEQQVKLYDLHFNATTPP